MNRYHFLAFLLAAALHAPGGRAARGAQGQAVALQNPGFEGAYRPVASSSDAPNQKARITGQMAEGWGDNSDWADVDVDYGRETAGPHRGQAAQRVRVTRVASGAVQVVQSVPLKKGRVHRWRLWLRGQPATAVELMLRQAGAPYTTYASQTASLAAEWQEFRVFAVIPEDTQGFLMIRAAQPMTFYIDDAGLEDLTDADNNAPARQGNLVTSGGSFEAGLGYGWSVRFEGPVRNRFADPRPSVDRTTAAHGRASLRCDVRDGDSVRVASPLLTFNHNRAHTISVWLKASRPLAIDMELEQAGIRGTAQVTTEWKRFAFSGQTPFLPHTRLRLVCPSPYTGGGVRLWFDGVMVEEAAAASPAYSAPHPAEVALRLARPGHVVPVGDRTAAVAITTAGNVPPGARLELAAEDLSGKRTALPPVALRARSFPVPAMGGRRGMWKLRARVVDRQGRPLSAPAELVWARLPRPKELDPRRSFFGAHIPLAPDYVRLARAVGIRRARTHDTSMLAKWPDAEPKEGVWEYHREPVAFAAKNGIAILGMLDGAPRWAATKPREGGYWGIWHIPDAPGAGEKWETYVRNVVTNYPEIREWEVWNEPWGNWFLGAGGTPALYADLMRRAYRVAKQARPGVTILGVDTYRGSEQGWTEPVLAASGTGAFDGFSFHDYNDALFGGADPFPAGQARLFNGLQKKVGTPKPLWNTEGGLFGVGSWYAPETGGLSARLQPAFMVRYDVTYMAAGVRAFWLYAIHTDPEMGNTSTTGTEHDRAVKPMLGARAVLASLVDGAGVPKRTEPVKGVDAYAFPPQQNRTVTVLWSYEGTPRRVPVPRGARVLDVWGNPLAPAAGGAVSVGPEPVYFVR